MFQSNFHEGPINWWSPRPKFCESPTLEPSVIDAYPRMYTEVKNEDGFWFIRCVSRDTVCRKLSKSIDVCRSTCIMATFSEPKLVHFWDGQMSVSICRSVCLSRAYLMTHMLKLHHTPMPVAGSCFGGVALRYVLPVLWMTLCSAYNGPKAAWLYRRTAAASLQCRVRPNTPTACYWVALCPRWRRTAKTRRVHCAKGTGAEHAALPCYCYWWWWQLLASQSWCIFETGRWACQFVGLSVCREHISGTTCSDFTKLRRP